MINNTLMKEYRSRINRVEDYIQLNLDADMNLDELADVAAFSKFHFARIFTMITGETLFQYIQRMRIEKAASMLLANPGISVTETACACGFSSSQAFSRSFRQRFGVSATRWRAIGGRTPEIIERIQRLQKRLDKDKNADPVSRPAEHTLTNLVPEKISIVEIDDIEVIYVRYTGPFQADTGLFTGLFEKLYRWADSRSLRDSGSRTFCIVHTNPAITDDHKIRLSCCLSVREDVKPEGEISRMTIKGGRYARALYSINDLQYSQAWSYFYTKWLPSSGFQPDEQPAFEEYLEGADQSSPESTSLEKHPVLLWLPVRPL